MTWRKTTLASAMALALTLLVGAPVSAQDDERRVDEPVYLTLDMGVSGIVNDPVEDQFEVGGDGALGLYFSLIPELAIGGQVRGGALAEGNPIPQDPVDRGVADYGLLAASVRIHPFASLMEAHTMHRAAGFYLEASPGVGIFDGEIVPAYTAGAGYNFPVGPIAIGPKFRFTHFIETEGRFGDNDVLMLTGGLEIAFLDEAEVMEPEPRAEAPAPEPEPEPVAVIEELPTLAIEPEPALEPQVNEALVVDERAYFDYDEVELRPEAREDLDAVVAHWREHGDAYETLVVSGHADDRGSDQYNEALSAARALSVTSYLISAGVPVDVIEVRAYGETAPLVENATTSYEFQMNRRVQFDVIWNEERRPVGVAPEPNPTLPHYVDAAPARVRAVPERWEEASPPPAGTSRAERLLEEQRQALRERVDAPVTITMRDAADTADAVARVDIEVDEGPVATR